jgi:hypothetical protein
VVAVVLLLPELLLEMEAAMVEHINKHRPGLVPGGIPVTVALARLILQTAMLARAAAADLAAALHS